MLVISTRILQLHHVKKILFYVNTNLIGNGKQHGDTVA